VVTITITKLDRKWFPRACCGVSYKDAKVFMDHVLATHEAVGSGAMTTADAPPVVEQLRVSARSQPNAVAGAIASVVRQHRNVEVQVVGAGALNQAVKAMAIARGFLASSDVDLVMTPTFANVEIDGQDRTALRLRIEPR
jgi:stage V sporulation protein S